MFFKSSPFNVELVFFIYKPPYIYITVKKRSCSGKQDPKGIKFRIPPLECPVRNRDTKFLITHIF